MKFIYLFLTLFMTSASFAQSSQNIPFEEAMGAAMLIKSKMLVIYQKELNKGDVDDHLKKCISNINGSIIQCHQTMQTINKNLIPEDKKATISKIVADMTNISERLDTIKESSMLYEQLDTLNAMAKELETIIQNKGKKKKR